MSIEVTLIIQCDDWNDKVKLEQLIAERYNRYSMHVDRTEHHGDSLDVYDELADDEVDEEMVLTILKTASQRASHPEARMQLTQLIHALQAPEPAVVPPHPDNVRSQGSGIRIDNLESVACPTCHAPMGTPCITESGKRYYPGWGHQARIALVAPNHRRPGR